MVDLPYSADITINDELLQLLSENKIFLSNDNILNDFMYSKHVLSYQKKNKQAIITNLGLSSNFFISEEKLLKRLDAKLWSQIPHQNNFWWWFPEEVYVFSDELPFD